MEIGPQLPKAVSPPGARGVADPGSAPLDGFRQGRRRENDGSAALGFNTRLGAARRWTFARWIPRLRSMTSSKATYRTSLGPSSKIPNFGPPKWTLSLSSGLGSRIREMIDEATTAEVSTMHVDLSFERQLFTQLLESVPPGLDEILAVLRVLDLVREASGQVLIDMAPTGHALDLLRTPNGSSCGPGYY